MTGPTEPLEPFPDEAPQILVDGWPDGYIEEHAYVAVGDLCKSSEEALAWIERVYPADDLEDGASYHDFDCVKQWMRPTPGTVDDGEGRPWEHCAAEDEGAVEFWVVGVDLP